VTTRCHSPPSPRRPSTTPTHAIRPPPLALAHFDSSSRLGTPPPAAAAVSARYPVTVPYGFSETAARPSSSPQPQHSQQLHARRYHYAYSPRTPPSLVTIPTTPPLWASASTLMSARNHRTFSPRRAASSQPPARRASSAHAWFASRAGPEGDYYPWSRHRHHTDDNERPGCVYDRLGSRSESVAVVAHRTCC
jgi:hypothetical protein